MKNFKWNKKYLHWGVTAFLVIVASIVFFMMLSRWRDFTAAFSSLIRVLAPFIYGLVIAYVLNKIVALLESALFLKLGGRMYPRDDVRARKAARIMAITAALVLAMGFVALLLIIMLPQIFFSIRELVGKSSSYVDAIVKWVRRLFSDDSTLEPIVVEWLNKIVTHLMNWLETELLPQMSTLVSSITSGVLGVVRVVVNLFIGVVMSIYLMYNKETFLAQAKKQLYVALSPKAANNVISEMRFVNKAFGDYLVGTLIDALIVGIVNFIFMEIANMPYAALISIIVAVTNIIPMFGPFIGAIPSALLILLESPPKALIFVIFTLVLQQFDGQLLKPRIHASRSGLSGFWIMFAIIFFGGLFGIVGMIIGVPLITVIYRIVRRINNRRLTAKGMPTETVRYDNLSYVDTENGDFIYEDAAQEDAVYEEAPAEEENGAVPENDDIGEDAE